MYQPPTAHVIDPSTGHLSAATGRYEKRLSDLAGLYEDAQSFETLKVEDPDRIVYVVHEVRPQQTAGDLIFGTTWMQPGRVGREFFMTRGHIHATGNRPETYYGESGEGVMLLESPEGETRVLEIRPRVMVYVPPMWIHRSVNTGLQPLVMSFCYPSDSGQDYGIIERSGGMAKRIVAGPEGWEAVDNAAYRPRTRAEIDAVLATAA